MNGATQPQSWILGIRRVVGATLALAIMLVPAVVATRSAQAQAYTYSVLDAFTGADGEGPTGRLALDAQGNLYGTTPSGGAYGFGTVFKVDTTGAEIVLYSFTGTGGDAENPHAGLVLDAQGNLYGTTPDGGAFADGTVFKVDPNGTETVLYSFTGAGGDGASPSSSLVLDTLGNLYGTTLMGGSDNKGTVFKVDTNGKESVLYSFLNRPDANYPNCVVLDAQGNLYGTTFGGGTDDHGTVFKVDTNGKESVLYSFLNRPDGRYPDGVVLDAQGNLFGTTAGGGDIYCPYDGGCGTVFKVDTNGNETLLYNFSWAGGVGRNPNGGVVLDAQGNLYGTTLYGGFYDKGTVFMLAANGYESVLHSFSGRKGDGQWPNAGVVLDAQGNLYGTTFIGGPMYGPCRIYGNQPGCGTVFDLLTPAAATTTALTSAPNPSAPGQAVTFTAVVRGGAGVPHDGETVAFMRRRTLLGTGALNGGSATFLTSTLANGTTTVTAVYGGDVLFARSTSNAVTQVVSKVATTASLSSSHNPSAEGRAVTFTAAITSSLGTPPDGETVTFKKGKTVLGTGSLSGGSATFTTSALPVGTNSIRAVYGGDSTFLASKSNTVIQVVLEKAGE
jgi:uncharacterized repeat protein (TIGR03803 family)